MKKFLDTLWQGVAILIVILLAVGIGWWLIYYRRNPFSVLRRAYGEIVNPAREADKSRAAAIRDALNVVWNDDE